MPLLDNQKVKKHARRVEWLGLGLTLMLLSSACGDGNGTPNMPTGLTTKPGDSQVTLEWLAVTGVTIQSYTVTWGTSPATPSQTVTVAGTVTQYTAHGLTNGTKYYFAVSALSSAGLRSAASAPVAGTPNGSTTGKGATLTGSVPADGATGASINTPFQLDFSAAMDTTSVQITSSPSLTLSLPNWTNGDTTANFVSATALLPGTQYTISVTGQTAVGGPLSSDASYSFTTVSGPQIVAVMQNDEGSIGVTSVPTSASIYIDFSEAMDTTDPLSVVISPSITTDQAWYVSNRRLRMTRRDFSGGSGTFPPPVPLTANTQYTVTIPAGALSETGVPSGGSQSFSFTVGAADTVAPTVLSTSPADGDQSSVSDPTQIQFSEPMNEAAVNAAVSVTSPSGVDLSMFWNDDSSLFTFYPATAWTAGTAVTFQVTRAALDISGNPIPATVTFTFTPS
jgi:hypothetical protein